MLGNSVVWRGVLVAAAVLCIIPTAHAQRFSVTGVVEDSLGIALPQAAVVALAGTDSILVQFGTSDSDGRFTLHRLAPGGYILQVSYVGHQTLVQDFEVQRANVDVGRLVLLPQTQMLEEFVVTADRLPYVVRGDTIEYNALAFLTRPQDMVEDLLRRLPGIDVDRFGTIVAQGEAVKNVLVEGKEFFSSDHTIATRNLPADAVDKVQVYDKPSDRAELTGVPDGQEEKTVNLALTEEAKRGAFGQTTGGLGGVRWDQGRYFGRASVFRFAPLTQLALIGNADNVNQPGFSMNQLRSFRGAGSIIRPGDGISESLGAGFNVNRDVGDNTTINASYFFTDHTNTREAAMLRQELLGAAVSAFSDRSSNRRSGDLSHSAVLQADLKLGEGHDLRFEGTLSRALSSEGRTGLESTTDPLGMLLNAATISSSNEADNLSGDARLTWRKRISPNGRSLVVTGTVDAREADAATSLNTETRLYSLGDIQTRDELHQEQELQSSSFRYGHQLEVLQPLRTGRMLSLYLYRAATDRRQDKAYFDIVDGRSVLNPSLSEEYGQHYEYWRSGTDFTLQADDKSWWVWSKITAQHSRRRGTVRGLDQAIWSRFTHLLPSVIVTSDLGDDSGGVTMRYKTSTREPSLRQLQPFTDNSNPLRIYIGNPALTPEYRHDLSVRYQLLRDYSGLSLYADLGTVYTRNSIIRERTVDARLRQTLRAINAGAVWSADGRISFGMPIRPLGIEWDLSNAVDMEAGTEFINGEENDSQVLRNRLRLDINYYHGDAVGITTRGSITYNRVRYSLNEELNQSYINSTVDVEAFWHPTDNWSFESSLLYRIFDRDLFGAGQDIALLNLSLSRLFFAGRGNLEFEFNDVLNHNQGVTITNAATYIEEARVVSLGRNVMLKFTYKPRLM